MPKIRVVSECPRCKSEKTGIIQFDFEPTGKAVRRFAKKGCYIKQYPPSEYRKYHIAPNCFCSECNYEWVGPQETKKITYNEYDKYLISRKLDPNSLSAPRKTSKIMRVFSQVWDAIRWR